MPGWVWSTWRRWCDVFEAIPRFVSPCEKDSQLDATNCERDETHKLVDEETKDVTLLLRLVAQQTREVHDGLRARVRKRVDRHLL